MIWIKGPGSQPPASDGWRPVLGEASKIVLDLLGHRPSGIRKAGGFWCESHAQGGRRTGISFKCISMKMVTFCGRETPGG